MKITCRPATETEKLNVDEEAATLPGGVVAWDSTDWNCAIFACLSPGDWHIHIIDPTDSVLNSQESGVFVVHLSDEGDGGFYRQEGFAVSD